MAKKTITLRFNHCGSCPDFSDGRDWPPYYNDRCMRAIDEETKTYKFLTDRHSIPDWCPLPDAEEDTPNDHT